MGRRRALTLLVGAGASVVALAACGGSGDDSAATTSTTAGSDGNGPGAPPGGGAPAAAASSGDSDAIPEETAGPYPGDGSNGPNVLTLDGVVRQDIRSSFAGASGTADGVPLTIDLQIVDGGSGDPVPGAAVYVWHCTRDGAYSMYGDIEGENFLRGVQVADDAGRLSFTSIFPGAYSGRWPHIHFEVYPDETEATSAGDPTVTSQIALPQDTCEQVYATDGYEDSVTNLARTSLDSDMVFSDDGAAEQLATMSGSISGGLTATLTVPI
jgi:protocatechuate 3,4-dioxygenase beta subunit